MKFIVEVIAFWVLPLALLIEYHYWQSIAWATPEFIFYIIAVPTIAAYMIVATGAGWLKLWGFNLKYTLWKVPIQIGLVYGSVINGLFLIFVNLVSLPSSVSSTIAIAILIAISGALLGCLYDISIMHYGILDVYIRPFYKRDNTIKIVTAYGPRFFGLMGFVMGLSVKLGVYLLIETDRTISLLVAAPLGILIVYTPFLLYLLVIIEQKRHKTERR